MLNNILFEVENKKREIPHGVVVVSTTIMVFSQNRNKFYLPMIPQTFQNVFQVEESLTTTDFFFKSNDVNLEKSL